MNNEINNLLSFDPIAQTEKIFGKKHWSQFTKDEDRFALKANILKAANDTYFSIAWDEFKNLLKFYGFIDGLTYEFDYEQRKEEAIIHYHPTKGLLIFATSWGKQSINSGNLYGEIKAKSKEDCKTIFRWLSTGGCIDQENMIYETQQDVREGLFSKLNELETAGDFLNKWTNKNRFLWFVDYAEDKVPGYDYKAITQNKIEKFPIEARKIIGR
jgi:hypothetical protein